MSRERINRLTEKTRKALPPEMPDASGAGVNYADALVRLLKVTLEDGRRVKARRRGLEIVLEVGDSRGSALLRRLENGPDIETIVHRALSDAAAAAGASLCIEEGAIWLEG
jgi:hypothetical protein